MQLSRINREHDQIEGIAVADVSRAFPELDNIEVVELGSTTYVYRASQKSLNRVVALHILAPAIHADSELVQRFTSETQSIAKLSHPHIVSIYDFGQRGAFLYQVTEYVEGRNLSELIASGHIEVSEALGIVSQICDGLQYAHHHGVAHNHLNPLNVLVDEHGQVKIINFGTLTNMTRARRSAGHAKPEIKRPEDRQPRESGNSDGAILQADDQTNVKTQMDIIAVGTVFYEMLTGMHVHDHAGLSFQDGKIDIRLQGIVSQALESGTKPHFRNVGEIKTEIDRLAGTFARTNPIATTHDSAVYEPAGTDRARWWFLAAILCMLIILIASVGTTAKRQAKVDTAPVNNIPVPEAIIHTGPLATLPDGRTIEFVALSEHPDEGNQWWTPDGALLFNPPYEYSAGILPADPAFVMRGLLFRVVPYSPETVTIALLNRAYICGVPKPARHGKTNVSWVAVTRFPAGMNDATIRLGVADGPWVVAGQSTGNHQVDRSPESVIRDEFQAAKESQDGVRLGVTYFDPDCEVRVIAVGQNDQEINPGSMSTMVSRRSVELKAYFPDIKLIEIKRFELQIRPFQIVKFSNIALRPGVKTDPAGAHVARTALKDR